MLYRKLELDDKIKQFEGMEKRHRQIGLELADTIPGKEALVNVMAKQRDNLKIDYDLYRNQREADGDKFRITFNGRRTYRFRKSLGGAFCRNDDLHRTQGHWRVLRALRSSLNAKRLLVGVLAIP